MIGKLLSTHFFAAPKLAGIAILTLILTACSAQQAPKESWSQAQMRNQLSSLGISMCGGSSVTTSTGDGASGDFRAVYRQTWKCTNDVFWYQYVHQENGASLSWSTDIDRLNNSVRRLHETNKIKKILSGPNFSSSDVKEADESLPSYLDARYLPGAIRPKVDGARTEVESIAGTVWDAETSADQITAFFFDANGAIRIHDEKGLHTNASWRQEGSIIFIEMNDHYVEHYGVVDSDVMVGNSWNATGARWTWRAKKRTGPD